MALAWIPITGSLEFGGYAHWEAASEAAAPGTMFPILARLVKPATGTLDLAGAIAATLTLPGLEFAAHEKDLLQTEQVMAGAGWPHEVRFVAYAPRERLSDLPPYWQVLSVGPGFLPAEAAPPAQDGQVLTLLDGNLAPDLPVLAVIDEGIGFLNARFRASRARSRFLGLWLQAAERLPQSPTGPRGDVRLGRVLTGTEIDALLVSGRTEAECYSQVNRVLYPMPDRRALSARVGHGTHVLDLACGAGFDEPMAQVPILAVQLPPASIRETSGRRMEAHLVQGLRWILAEVLRRAKGTDVPPVVLNLSLGSLAGPGDDTEFLAEWMAFEIERHRRMAPGAEVRIVGAYGNSRLSRLVARTDLRIRHPLALDWRILPDDGTASFLELRVEQPQADGLSLRLEPPAGSGLPVLMADWPSAPAPSGWVLTAASGPVAAVAFLRERSGQALLHLSVAPTRPRPGAVCAAPGLWRLHLATAGTEPVRLIARVQRDDTPFGHAVLGRQSWLDHPEAWTWDPESRSYTRPEPGGDGTLPCPVTRQGTAVSFAGASHPDIWLVGSVRPGHVEDDWWPSAFSAQGAVTLARPGESAGPTVVAPGEAGPAIGGIAASGVLTGSRARLKGTSMAAPAVARRLLEYFRQTPPDDRSTAAERAFVVAPNAWDPETDPRLGHGIAATA